MGSTLSTRAGESVNAWIHGLRMVVGCTVLGDLLQSFEMKRHGEIHDFHPRGWAGLLATLARRNS